MTLTTLWTILTKLLDICLVWLMFYYIIKNFKKNVKLVLVIKITIILIITKILSDLLDLYTVGLLLEYVILWGPLALVIIFQPEIRSYLEQYSATQLVGKHRTLSVDEREEMVYSIMDAVEHLKRNRIGALIVVERNQSLGDYIKPATQLNAKLNSGLIESLFNPSSPLSTGGIIIQGNQISAVNVVFKTSIDPTINKRLGTRHRAGLGIAEETDAIALIISEETGKISIACDKQLHYNLTLDDFKMMFIQELKPKTEVFYDADDQVEEGDIDE